MVTKDHEHAWLAAGPVRFFLILALTVIAAATIARSGNGQPAGGGADLPDYRRVRGLSGQLRCAASPAVRPLVDRWKKEFTRIYRSVSLEVVSVESASVPPALLEGACELAAMDRSLSDSELDSFAAKFGHPPESFKAAAEGIAVLVNRENPIVGGLSLRQLDGIFSASPRRGGPVIEAWGDVGVAGDWAGTPIIPISPGPAAGERALFQSIVLGGGEFRSDVKPGRVPSSVVQDVGIDRGAVGYARNLFLFKGRRTRPVPLSSGDGPFVALTREACLDGSYPLSRFIFMFVKRKPGEALDPLLAEFLRFICSRPGQRFAEQAGYFQLSAELVTEQRRRLAGRE